MNYSRTITISMEFSIKKYPSNKMRTYALIINNLSICKTI